MPGDAEALEQALHVARPADRHRHRSDRVFEDEVPADHPRHNLTQRGVGIGVRTAGDRDHRRELGVAERRECARQPGGEIRHHDGRPGLVGSGSAREHEDARPDDGPDPEQGQIPRRQAAPEGLAAMFDVADQLFDRLRLEQIRIHSTSGGGLYRRLPASQPRVRRSAFSVRRPAGPQPPSRDGRRPSMPQWRTRPSHRRPAPRRPSRP